MKTRSFSFILIFSLVFMFKGMAMAQDPIAELFNETFPELQGELKFDENIKDLSPKAVTAYRAVLQKLDDAIDDLIAMEIGALAQENAKVFNYKALKKAKDLAGLKEMIIDNKHKIKEYMGDKTQYGADSLACIQNIALLQQSTKAGKWSVAYPYWNTLFHYYPRSIKTIYSKGADIVEFKMAGVKDEATKQKWIDTLIMMYDKRIKFFGDDKKYPEGYIRGLKAVDLIKYRKESVEQAYGEFEKSVKLQGVESENAVLLSYMQATQGMFQEAKKIDAAQVVDNYEKIMALLDQRTKKYPNDQDIPKAIDGVNTIFLNSEASTCDKLIPAFEKKFKANQNDIELLKKIAGMLDRKECTESQLFTDVIVRMDELEPSAMSKYGLGMKFVKEKDYEKASTYLEEAISLETEDTLKAKYYYKLAYVSNERGRKSEARTQALKAASLKSNYGLPYVLIATMYASSGCSSLGGVDGEIPGVAYWVAVDKLVKARSIDPSVSESASTLISRYSGGFPNAEKAFMFGVTKGKTYTVGCWINETTTARF